MPSLGQEPAGDERVLLRSAQDQSRDDMNDSQFTIFDLRFKICDSPFQ
jgi:hypothetical protein